MDGENGAGRNLALQKPGAPAVPFAHGLQRASATRRLEQPNEHDGDLRG